MFCNVMRRRILDRRLPGNRICRKAENRQKIGHRPDLDRLKPAGLPVHSCLRRIPDKSRNSGFNLCDRIWECIQFLNINARCFPIRSHILLVLISRPKVPPLTLSPLSPSHPLTPLTLSPSYPPNNRRASFKDSAIRSTSLFVLYGAKDTRVLPGKPK